MDATALAHLLWLIPLALLVAYVGSPRFLGTSARARVCRLLRASLERQRYSVLDDLTLPSGGGTIHVDVVVVSRTGIFVIDVLHKRGRLTGTRVQPYWVEKRFGRARRFANPVHANFLRIQALERLLRLPLSRFHGVVAVSGRDRLDAGLPADLVPVRQLVARVRSESRPLLEAEEADRVLQKLHQSALRPSWRESGRGWKWLRAALFILLVTGAYAAYRPELHRLAATVQHHADMRMAPENFHPDGRPKTEREIWEDRLVCAYSADTGRCACYEPRGGHAEIADSRCRELAERGSILKQ